MADKILTEAFDKLKAIEESEDPFCIGELSENEEDVEEAVVEDEEVSEDEEVVEAVDAWAEPKSYEIETDHGDNYAIHFQDGGQGTERAFLEENGITIATYTVGGAGAMQAHIKDADAVLNAVTFALRAANGSGQ